MIKKIACWYSLVFIGSTSYAQELKTSQSNSRCQQGFAVKASFELAEYKKFTFRFGISAGVGKLMAGDGIFSSLHADFMFYNNGFGSQKYVTPKPKLVTDFLLSGTITKGWQNRMKLASRIKPGIRNYPFYYFSNFPVHRYKIHTIILSLLAQTWFIIQRINIPSSKSGFLIYI